MTHPKKPKQDVESLEAGAEQTRTRIGEDLRAIGDKLSPQNIKEEIKTEAKEALVQAKDTAVEKLQDVKETVTDAGRATVSYASRNAVPLALIGAGVGWLLATRRSRSSRRRGYEVRTVRAEPSWGREKVERAEEMMHEGAERGREIGREAQHRLQRAGERSRELANESPLALGALAVAAGVGVGMMLPTTRKEDETMGPARDRLVGEARDTAEQIGQTAKQAAREIKQKVTEPLTH